MGLTIHFRLHSDASPADARKLIERLRQRASNLPLAKVGKIVERVGADCDITNCRPADRPLLGTAVQFLIEGETGHPVEPTHVIGFSTLPGDGCEFAHFGLARYPATIKVEGQQRATDLTGWNWTGHTKTQYASNPSTGDIENFLRCHLGVIAMCDFAKEIGVLKEVVDEGEYWEKRDVRALTETVGKWNAMIAGFVGQWKDRHGDRFVAEITAFPNFEHLEAEGREGEDESR
jgi:hypothetical protein